MPNIAAVLKTEITRLARKEVLREVTALRRAAREQRAEIVELRKAVKQLTRGVTRAARAAGRAAVASPSSTDKPSVQRFSSKGLGAQRRRLGLSAAAFGRLLGASPQTVYNWESGKVRPRASQMAAIAAVRRLGKREAARRLEA